MAKLTEALVRDLTAPDTGESTEWDTAVRGFGCRIRPGGKKVFVVKYRTATGQQRKMTLGAWPVMTVDEARRRAKQALGAVADGKDPAGEKAADQAAPTMADLARDYIARAEITKRASSVRNDRGMWERNILPVLGQVKVKDVTRKQVESLHRAMKDTPYAANRVLALLSNAFSVAKGWDWRLDNPVQGIARYQEEKRQRWYHGEEAARLLAVLQGHPNRRGANAMLLLLLTGARKGEVLGATWDQFDLDRAVWTKPAHTTKQKRVEHVPLSPHAIELLRGLKEGADPDGLFLFPGDAPGKPYQEPKRFWAAVCKAADLEDAHIHDLRHTFISMLVSSGVPLYTAGRLAGHTQAATTQRYAHLSDDPLRQATTQLGIMVEGIKGKRGKDDG